MPDDARHVLGLLADRCRQHGWWDQYAHVLHGQLDYVIVEWIAGEAMTWHQAAIPVLLQTPRYARAAATAAGAVSGAELETVLAAQAARQPGRPSCSGRSGSWRRSSARRRCGSSRPRPAGDGRAAGSSGRPGAAVREPHHPGAAAGRVRCRGRLGVLDLAVPAVPSLGVVSLPTLSGHAHLQDCESLTRYQRAFAQLRAAALSPADTVPLLRGIAGELRPPWD